MRAQDDERKTKILELQRKLAAIEAGEGDDSGLPKNKPMDPLLSAMNKDEKQKLMVK